MSKVYKTDAQGRRYEEVVVRVYHSTTDWGQVTLYNDDPKYWCNIVGTIGESIHQSFDGWEPHEQVVIEKYLDDIVAACNNEYGICYDDPTNRFGPHPLRNINK